MRTLLVLCLLVSTSLFAQKEQSIIVNEKYELVVNGKTITKETTFEQIQQVLGKAKLLKDYPTGKKAYVYPELGLALHTYNDKVIMVGANLNWDGDEKFPEKSYEGALSVGTVKLDKSNNRRIMDEIKMFEFKEMFGGLYLGKGANDALMIMVGFENGKITQIGFNFNPR